MSNSMRKEGERAARKFLAKQEARKLIGKVVVGLYPRHNFIGVQSANELRRVKVESVRLVAEEPLDPETIKLQPLLHRGEVLVTGFDMDRGAERSFWLERFVRPRVCEYSAEAMRSRRQCLMVVERCGTREIVNIQDPRGGYIQANRELEPETIIYPISSAILTANDTRRAV